jgi:hypothetical protein
VPAAQALAPGQAAPPWPGPAGGAQPSVRSVGFFQLSLTRAFRLYIDPAEVLETERAELETSTPPVINPEVQAFLAWRRSVLFVVAVLFVPLLILIAIETFGQDTGGEDNPLLGFQVIVLLINTAFAGYLWVLLKQWTHWRAQRRKLMRAWLLYFLAPFLVFLYPLRSMMPEGTPKGVGLALGIVYSVYAIIVLAPKAISLLPGLLRAALVNKQLFPGASAPGWILTLIAPIYALLVYTTLVMPFQISGSGWFILAIGGLLLAQFWLGKLGLSLARPMSRDEAVQAIRAARTRYLLANLAGVLFIFIAVWDLVSQLEISTLSVFQILLSLAVNILLLTMIATDVLLVGMERARGLIGAPGAAEAAQRYEQHLAVFMHADEVAPGAGVSPQNPGPPQGGPPGAMPHGGAPGGFGAPPPGGS